MILALEPGLPSRDQMELLLNKAACDSGDWNPSAWSASECQAFSAFDNGHLVGVGVWVNAGTPETPQLRFVIERGYESREIAAYMAKLLCPARRSPAASVKKDTAASA